MNPSILAWILVAGAAADAPPAVPSAQVNSLGMKMVAIPAGTFDMGQAEGGEFDERPVHKVTISRPLLLAATEVTNAQYEQFDPKHKELRGRRGLSKDDGEAVIFVSWEQATAFCTWLSQKEGKPYRLPTEAEWEYACRAGTTTAYHTGQSLPAEFHRNQKFGWHPAPVGLAVGKTPANAWGLHDMHGNVEEWCLDGYGPYEAGEQTDPVGRAGGEMKVCRGGSHNTDLAFLRSANRSGTLAGDRHWLIGFRVACGELAGSRPLPAPPAPLWARGVRQAKAEWKPPCDMSKPYFGPVRTFVRIPPGSNGPMYSKHNHCPSITWCENGDLLAAWFSTNSEAGREMTILASRLRPGAERWDDAAEFFKAPDRNMTGSALFHDGSGRLLHFNGLEAGGGWANLALVLRTSTDNGATWQSRLIDPEHQPRNQVISGTLRTKEGLLIQACDAVYGGNGGTAIHVSADGGTTWSDPGAGTPVPRFAAGASGATIAGIHAGLVQLSDGRLMAFGRGDTIRTDQGDRMPMSLSADQGRTWTYSASPFTPISGGQRLVLVRLREGPLLFCSFTDPSSAILRRGMSVTDSSGKPRTVFGLFAAVSEDDGKTWPFRRLISDDGPGRQLDGGAWTRGFTMDAAHGEPKGYLCFTQTPDGVIHLLSSAVHYQFNLAWLTSPPPPAPAAATTSAPADRADAPDGQPALRVEGPGLVLGRLDDGQKAFGNRTYVWSGLPSQLKGWQFTQTRGGERASLTVIAPRGGTIHVATALSQKTIDLAGWEKVEGLAFRYTDHNQTEMGVFRRRLKAGEKVAIPQGNWTGGIVLAPRLEAVVVEPELDLSLVPGVVVHHSPASSGLYVGSPGIAVLDDGSYLAKCDLFGPKSKEWESALTLVFRSTDKGRTWSQVARVEGLFWANLFVHRGRAYMIGTNRHHGLPVIVRSDDGGRTWTHPKDAATGLLAETGEYHTAPMPMAIHQGRIWRAIEDAGGGKRWGIRYRAMLMSAPLEADLLHRSSWTFTNFLPGEAAWLEGRFGGWLEGNAVVTPEGRLVNILRADCPRGGKAAMVRASEDGRSVSFDSAKDFIDFPGGAKKFTIRRDPRTGRYWSLSNPVPPAFAGEAAPGTRNTLALLSSADLRTWEVRCLLLHHADRSAHGFQYPDWVIEGEDLLAAVRTAYDDGLGGARNAHDANFLTFHRFANFRKLTMADSCVKPGSLGYRP